MYVKHANITCKYFAMVYSWEQPMRSLHHWERETAIMGSIWISKDRKDWANFSIESPEKMFLDFEKNMFLLTKIYFFNIFKSG